MPEFSIVEASTERLNEFEHLWGALYAHHQALTPQLSDRARPLEDAWAARRRIEQRWLRDEPLSFVLMAEADEQLIGYALVRVRQAAEFAASWEVSDPLAELATLVVLPEHRSKGVGSALLDEVESRLREMEVGDMTIGVIATNLDAIRLYERRGAVPILTELLLRVAQ